jgi:spore germination protein KA
MEESPDLLTKDINRNLEHIKKLFSYPINQDFVVRNLYIPSLKAGVALIFLSGMVNEDKIERNIISPLASVDIRQIGEETLQNTLRRVITVESFKTVSDFKNVIHHILNGHTLLIIDGHPEAISIPTIGYKHRNVEKPETEMVLKGPKEAFVESVPINLSLIRKQIKDAHLLTETMLVGQRDQNEVSMMYIKDIANPELVEKVKQRISEIEAEHILNLSILEQHIEERPYSLVPTVLYTERPDRAASFLKEGHIILLMDSSPDCLIVPVTFWSFFHTAEDQYQRWAFGNLMRIVRLFAFFIALLAPATYIAVTNFHVEMIPTDLLFTIAATRQNVPFPGLFELIIMEITFDIVREAGIRMPTRVGHTVAIITALLISMASIIAGIVSPILVVIVGFSSLASYTIPTNSFNFAVRIARFGFIALVAFTGFLGMAIGVAVCVAYLVTVKSFDVPFVSPMAPHYRSSKDMVVRPPVWKQWLRPLYLYPHNQVRSKKPGGGSNS